MNNNTDRKQVIHEIIAGMNLEAKLAAYSCYMRMPADNMTDAQMDFTYVISRDEDVQKYLTDGAPRECTDNWRITHYRMFDEQQGKWVKKPIDQLQHEQIEEIEEEEEDDLCDCDTCKAVWQRDKPSGGVQRDKIYVDEIDGDNRKPFSWKLYKEEFDYKKIVTRDGRVVSKIEKDKGLFPLRAYGSNGEYIGTLTMDGYYNPDRSPHHSDLFFVKDGAHRTDFSDFSK